MALEAAIPKAGETPKNNTGTESMEGLVVLSPGWNLQPQKSEGGRLQTQILASDQAEVFLIQSAGE